MQKQQQGMETNCKDIVLLPKECLFGEELVTGVSQNITKTRPSNIQRFLVIKNANFQ